MGSPWSLKGEVTLLSGKQHEFTLNAKRPVDGSDGLRWALRSVFPAVGLPVNTTNGKCCIRYKEHQVGWDTWCEQLELDPNESHGKSLDSMRRTNNSGCLENMEQEFWVNTTFCSGSSSCGTLAEDNGRQRCW